MLFYFVCFFNDTATTDIYTYLHTLSLHDARPIWPRPWRGRKSTRLNSMVTVLPSSDSGVIRSWAARKSLCWPIYGTWVISGRAVSTTVLKFSHRRLGGFWCGISLMRRPV